MHVQTRGPTASDAVPQGEPGKAGQKEAHKKSAGAGLGVFARIMEGLVRSPASLKQGETPERGSPANAKKKGAAENRLSGGRAALLEKAEKAEKKEKTAQTETGARRGPAREAGGAFEGQTVLTPEPRARGGVSEGEAAPRTVADGGYVLAGTGEHGVMTAKGKPARAAIETGDENSGAGEKREKTAQREKMGDPDRPEAREEQRFRGGLGREEIKKEGDADTRLSRERAQTGASEEREQNAAQEIAGVPAITSETERAKAGVSEAKGKRRERASLERMEKVEVRDFRSWEVVLRETGGASPSGADAQVNSAEEAAFAEIAPGERQGVPPAPETRPLTALEDMLARELHQNLNSDIVRHAQIILRNQSEGTIKLSLKPETLGNVKIHLEMAENKVTGRIIVESNEALKAFDREIHALEQAFKDSGFSGASLDTALSSGDKGDGTEHKPRSPFFSERFAAANYDAISDAALGTEVYFGGRTGSETPQINMLA
jgi:hypothetical protein